MSSKLIIMKFVICIIIILAILIILIIIIFIIMQIPLYVCSKLSKFKKASTFIITPSQYARSSIAAIGYETLVSPYWSHALQLYFADVLPGMSVLIRGYYQLIFAIYHSFSFIYRMFNCKNDARYAFNGSQIRKKEGG